MALGATAFLVTTSQVAQAHIGMHHTSGFAYGFEHPIGGLDHILAMVLVGVLAAQIGGRAIWLLPASFLVVMVLGGVVGEVGFDVPFVEVGIGLSIIVLGAIVALGLRIAVAFAMALVGFFAMFHGFAHGAEMPASRSGLGYGAGFLLATAALHTVGLGFGLALSRAAATRGGQMVKAAGGAAALTGVAIVTGLF